VQLFQTLQCAERVALGCLRRMMPVAGVRPV